MTDTVAPVGPDQSVEDDDEEDEGPIGLGDRLRHMLASSDTAEPLYPRVLRLKHVQPKAWQRALLVEGMAIAGGLVALADKATSWAPLILPAAAAVVVKFHDILAGLLPPRPAARPEDGDTAP
jgi:hypothetical protein